MIEEGPITRIVIVREPGGTWLVTRERRPPDENGGGESARTETLEGAFDFVRAAYDENGEPRRR